MTLKNLKRIYYAARNRGMTKEVAFEMLQTLVHEERNEKMDAIERFRYEINAEEQRRRDGGTY